MQTSTYSGRELDRWRLDAQRVRERLFAGRRRHVRRITRDRHPDLREDIEQYATSGLEEWR